MLNSNYQLSFGVELEFIFVFHEKLLIGQLRIDAGQRPFTKSNGAWLDEATVLQHQAHIQKDLPDWVREELRQGAPHYAFHNPYYPSWGLSEQRGQTALDSRPFTGNRIEGVRMTSTDENTSVRTYDLEPIKIAKEALLSNGAYDMWRAEGHPSHDTRLRIVARSGEGQYKPFLKFKYWHVTSDYSLSGLSQEELAAYLEKYKVCSGRDGSGASPFSNGLAMNSITNLYRPASESASSQSQGDPVLGGDILSALDNYLNTMEQDLNPHQPGSSNTPTWSVDVQDGSVSGKRKPGPITDKPLSKRTRLSASPELDKKQTGLPDVNDWDTYGVELVSSVLRPVPQDFETITRFCNLLKGERCHNHGATINDTCGLHVHLKPDGDGNDFDLNTMQHLAYIIAIYEREIDELHPFHRRTYAPRGATSYDFQSNTQKLQDYDGFLFERFTEIQNRIGRTQDMSELQRLMGKGKGYVVNFSNLLRNDPATDGPRTIEFRQHEGVLRGEMVEWWVKFCIGLLRLANHAATQLDADGIPIGDFHQQCQIYPFQEFDNRLSVWDLFDLIDFSEEGRRYFQRRAAYFADYTGNRDHTASLHSSDYGYKGPQRYRTPDPPSHSNLTSVSLGGSGNSKNSSLMKQIVTRVHRYLQDTQPSHNRDLAAIIARHSVAQLQADADKIAADTAVAATATADRFAADKIAAEEAVRQCETAAATARAAAERLVAERFVADRLAADNQTAGTARFRTAQRDLDKAQETLTAAAVALEHGLVAKKNPFPHPDSPSPFNPLPHSTTTYGLPPHDSNPFRSRDDTPPQIQPWIPINSPQGEKILRENNLPGLTGSPYEKTKPKPARTPRRNFINPGLRPKQPRRPRPSKSSSTTPSTPSPLRGVINASPPAATLPLPSSSNPFDPANPSLPTVPNPFTPPNPGVPAAPPSSPFSPFAPSILPSYSPPGLTPLFHQQQPPVVTPTPAGRTSGRGTVGAMASASAPAAKPAPPKPPKAEKPQRPQARQPMPAPPTPSAVTFQVDGKTVLQCSGTGPASGAPTVTSGPGYALTTTVLGTGGLVASMTVGGAAAGPSGAPFVPTLADVAEEVEEGFGG
ncbi:hypothetical protein MMC17_001474 [Xylographa soralifera]|nr:hypothetical protein [Xylographa soralifera]